MGNYYDYRGLNEKAKHFAISQLHENPLKVNDHIKRFREWVESNPHLICPKDSKFLLRFLRVSRFDHKKAQERLDNFCTTRGDLEYFDYPNVDDPKVSEYLETPLVVPLGRTDAGEMIVLMRSYLWNPETITFAQYMILRHMTLDILMEEEETQIYGIRFIIDVSDMSRKACICAANHKDFKNVQKIWHESFPMRLKGEVFYNDPEIFKHNFAMYTFYMDPRMKRRIFLVKDMETLMVKIPGVEKVLPTEYDGKGGPISVMGEKAKKQFREYYKNGNPLASVGVDESKRPEGASYFGDYGEYDGPLLKME